MSEEFPPPPYLGTAQVRSPQELQDGHYYLIVKFGFTAGRDWEAMLVRVVGATYERTGQITMRFAKVEIAEEQPEIIQEWDLKILAVVPYENGGWYQYAGLLRTEATALPPSGNARDLIDSETWNRLEAMHHERMPRVSLVSLVGVMEDILDDEKNKRGL